MAKRSNEQTLGEIIKEVLKTHRLEAGITKVRVSSIWDKVMGEFIASKTTNLFLQKDTLIVELNSAALRNELSYGKEKIIEAINKEVGKNVIKKIVIR